MMPRVRKVVQVEGATCSCSSSMLGSVHGKWFPKVRADCEQDLDKGSILSLMMAQISPVPLCYFYVHLYFPKCPGCPFRKYAHTVHMYPNCKSSLKWLKDSGVGWWTCHFFLHSISSFWWQARSTIFIVVKVHCSCSNRSHLKPPSWRALNNWIRCSCKVVLNQWWASAGENSSKCSALIPRSGLMNPSPFWGLDVCIYKVPRAFVMHIPVKILSERAYYLCGKKHFLKTQDYILKPIDTGFTVMMEDRSQNSMYFDQSPSNMSWEFIFW